MTISLSKRELTVVMFLLSNQARKLHDKDAAELWHKLEGQVQEDKRCQLANGEKEST